MIHKYTLLWEILVTLITFYDFSPACVLLWKVSDPRFFRSSIKSQTVEKPFICIYCVKKFSLICIFNIPTRKLLEKVFYASYKLSLLVKWKIWYIGLWFAFIILHWHNLKKIKNMHPSCSQNNVKNSSCFCDKITGRTRERFSLIVNSILIYLLYLRLYHTELYLFFVFQITVLCIGILIKAKQ